MDVTLVMRALITYQRGTVTDVALICVTIATQRVKVFNYTNTVSSIAKCLQDLLAHGV